MTAPPSPTFAHEYDSDGFTILRGALPKSFVSRILDEVAAFIERDMPRMQPAEAFTEDTDKRAVKALHGMDRYAPFFNELRNDGRLLDIVRAIWPGETIVAGSVSFFAKPARVGSVTPPHQDNGFHYWNPPQVLELTIALDASTLDNGVLICQRGSHRCGIFPHKPSGVMGFSRVIIDVPSTQTYPEVALCMTPGDIALHHIDVVHRSGANTSDRPRRQLGIGYRTTRAAQDQEMKARYQRDLDALVAKNR